MEQRYRVLVFNDAPMPTWKLLPTKYYYHDATLYVEGLQAIEIDAKMLPEQEAIDFVSSYVPVPRPSLTTLECRRRSIAMADEERQQRNASITNDIINTTMSLGDIAAKYGVSDQTVATVAKQIPGYDGKRRANKIMKRYEGMIDSSEKPLIYQRFLSGEKQANIANDYGVDNWVISYICRKMRAKQKEAQNVTNATTN